MLDLFPSVNRNCEGISRRSLLRFGLLSGLGLGLGRILGGSAQATDLAARPESTRKCILIWTQGGTSHHDTFDPKPEAALSVRGEFACIQTAIPGVQFTEVCPRMAQEANRFGLLRGWNPKNGSHGVADQWMMSGRNFSPAVPYPCYGSVIAQQRGFETALPPFVQLGNAMDRRFGGGQAGILGLQNNPFEILADPANTPFNVRDISPSGGMSMARIDKRRNFLSVVDKLQRSADLQPRAYDALDEHVKAAMNMITAPETQQAFRLDQEDPRLRDRYGRNTFGQSLLLARRLLETGVQFVTVTSPSWDTHQNNFVSLKQNLMPKVDQGIPELLIDLETRGMLDNTLVVWLTDFGRTPQINSASGRDHWDGAGFAIMAGAGIPGGTVIGQTDAQGGLPIRDQYLTENIAATIYAKLGLPLDLVVQAPDGRPVRLIEGDPIHEWM